MGVRGLLLGIPPPKKSPRPSHPFRACLRSGSAAPSQRPSSSAGRFNMLCVLPCIPHRHHHHHLNHHCPAGGTAAPCFKEPAKGTFQARVMSLDKDCVAAKGESGCGTPDIRPVISDMYILQRAGRNLKMHVSHDHCQALDFLSLKKKKTPQKKPRVGHCRRQ